MDVDSTFVKGEFIDELAELLDRHPDGLRQRFLNPMVGHGLLRLRYPDKPNRADQAYTADAPVRN